MMFGGFETIEAYEDDIYCEESSSESADSEVEFHLYSQVHYAQDLDNVREEKHEEMDSENSELLRRKPLQQNLIVVSDSEVIQLSDESEVITLSDEESIYRCKRKNTDTQSQEETRGAPASLYSKELAEKTCKRDIEKPQSEKRPGVLHEVMIIEVSSSEEEDSSASESDNVESWMLLGCEVDDDKDDDILLNLVGCDSSVHEAEDGVNWFIGDKDVEAQICNNRSSGRWAQRYYSANKNVTCRNCDKCGHLSKNCPRPQKVRSCCLCSERGHLQYACPARYCLDCSLPMSTSHRCFERSSWRKRCARCDMIGHYADACPEIWRQYHLTVSHVSFIAVTLAHFLLTSLKALEKLTVNSGLKSRPLSAEALRSASEHSREQRMAALGSDFLLRFWLFDLLDVIVHVKEPQSLHLKNGDNALWDS